MKRGDTKTNPIYDVTLYMLNAQSVHYTDTKNLPCWYLKLGRT